MLNAHLACAAFEQPLQPGDERWWGDDLHDGGAAHYAACVRAIKRHNPGTAVEALTPDKVIVLPDGTEDLTEAELAALVTRDAMIGVARIGAAV